MSIFTCDTNMDNILEEQYVLSKHANISFVDSNNMPDFERQALVGMLMRDVKKEEEMYREQGID